MAKNLDQALENVEMTYQQLVDIANEITTPLFNCMNTTIEEVVTNINNMTNDMLREYALQLSAQAFTLSETKEKSILKATCAEILKKESYSNQFISLEGSVALRECAATLNVSNDILVETIYNYVSSALKTKLAEVHSIIDTLKLVLTTRLSEAKLMTN